MSFQISSKPHLNPAHESRKERWMALFVLIGAVLLFMGRVSLNYFAYWDDQDFIFKNSHVTVPSWSNLGWFWTHTQSLLYVPLTMDSFVLLAKAAKLPNSDGLENPFDPAYFHTASLITHLATVLVVYTLIQLLFKRRWAACAGALLFALHPLQVESLAWTSGLKDLLAGFFGLTAVWQYLLYASATDAKFPSKRFSRPRIHLFVAIGAVVLGELSKPSAMVAPAIAVVLDYLLIGRSLKRVLISAWPLILSAVPLAVVAKLVQPGTIGPNVPLYLRPLIATDALAFYLYKFFLPFQLAPDYGRNPFRNLQHHWLFWTWVAPLMVAIIIIAWRKKYPWLLAAALVSVISVGPVLGLSGFSFEEISTVSDHYLYMALLGPAIVVAAIIQASRQRWIVALCWLVLAACGIRTTSQIGYWHDDLTLWKHASEVTPTGGAVTTNFAASNARIGREFERAAHRRAAFLEEKYGHEKSLAMISTDTALVEYKKQAQGYYSRAEAISRQFIDSRENNEPYILIRVYRNLVLALIDQNKSDEAAEWGYKLINFETQLSGVGIIEQSLDREALGIALLNTKTRNAEAAATFAEAVRLDPTNEYIQAALTLARKRLANPSRQAAVDFAKAIESGNLERIREVAFGSDEKFTYVHGFSDWSVAYKRYQIACIQKFGDNARLSLPAAAMNADLAQDAEEKIEGDSSTLTYKVANPQPIHIVKKADGWKVDLDALWEDVDVAQSRVRFKFMADVYNRMTDDVEAGKFKTVKDAQSDLQTRLNVQSPPKFNISDQRGATTHPASL